MGHDTENCCCTQHNVALAAALARKEAAAVLPPADDAPASAWQEWQRAEIARTAQFEDDLRDANAAHDASPLCPQCHKED